MLSKNPLVTIVILNWNGIEDTLLCIKHAKKLEYPNFEIIVVDNGSSDENKQKLRTIKNIKLIELPVNTGFTGGHIAGLKYAKGEFILLLNNDAVLRHDYLKIAMPIFEDKNIAVVGGRSYYWDKDNKLNDEQNAFYSYLEVNPFNGETVMKNNDFGKNQIVNTVSGSSVIVRKAAILKVGYLDKQFFAYYEETDLFARMKRAGYKIIYCPELAIWHKNGASSGASSGSYFFFYHIFRNRFIFAVRNLELKYFFRFTITYLRTGLSYISKIRHSEVQSIIGKAYLKALLVNIYRLPLLLLQRRKIMAINKKYSYAQTILMEQLELNLFISNKIEVPLSENNEFNNGDTLLTVSFSEHDKIIKSIKSIERKNHDPADRRYYVFANHKINLNELRKEIASLDKVNKKILAKFSAGKIVYCIISCDSIAVLQEMLKNYNDIFDSLCATYYYLSTRGLAGLLLNSDKPSFNKQVISMAEFEFSTNASVE